MRVILRTDLARAAPVLGQLLRSSKHCISGKRIHSNEATAGSKTGSDINRGVDLRSVKKGIDTRTAVGKFHYQIWGTMANFEQVCNPERGKAAAKHRVVRWGAVRVPRPKERRLGQVAAAGGHTDEVGHSPAGRNASQPALQVVPGRGSGQDPEPKPDRAGRTRPTGTSRLTLREAAEKGEKLLARVADLAVSESADGDLRA